jgi:hypothetical protein
MSLAAWRVLAGLVGALAWPGVIVVAILLFKKQVATLLDTATQFSLRAGPLQASWQRGVRAAAALAAATISKQSGPAQLATEHARRADVADQDSIVGAISAAVDPRVSPKLAGARILWVDDHPDNNVYERSALAALGAW